MAAPLLDPWRPGIETYHRLIEQGVFENVRVEFLDGVVTQMSPKSCEHEQALAHLTRLAVEATPPEVTVLVQLALSLGDDWEPEPDLALVERDSPRPYHPATAGLVVEVSASSLRHDREVKVPMYGCFGIPECWIVDVNARRVIRFREPTEEGYGSRDEHTVGVLRAVRFERLELDLGALWRATYR